MEVLVKSFNFFITLALIASLSSNALEAAAGGKRDKPATDEIKTEQAAKRQKIEVASSDSDSSDTDIEVTSSGSDTDTEKSGKKEKIETVIETVEEKIELGQADYNLALTLAFGKTAAQMMPNNFSYYNPMLATPLQFSTFPPYNSSSSSSSSSLSSSSSSYPGLDLLASYCFHTRHPKNDLNQTPLHYAVQVADEPAVKHLLEKGAPVNAQNSDGETPLHIAALWAHLDIAELLCQKGADETIKNRWGKTAAEIMQGNIKPKIDMPQLNLTSSITILKMQRQVEPLTQNHELLIDSPISSSASSSSSYQGDSGRTSTAQTNSNSLLQTSMPHAPAELSSSPTPTSTITMPISQEIKQAKKRQKTIPSTSTTEPTTTTTTSSCQSKKQSKQEKKEVKIAINRCTICFNNCTGQEKLLTCGHFFHNTCIKKWQKKKTNATCPTCRQEIKYFDLKLMQQSKKIRNFNDLLFTTLNAGDPQFIKVWNFLYSTIKHFDRSPFATLLRELLIKKSLKQDPHQSKEQHEKRETEEFQKNSTLASKILTLIKNAKLSMKYEDIRLFIQKATRSGLTPLHLAAQEGLKDILQLLIDLGHPLDQKDSNGNTPLHLAAQGGEEKHIRTYKVLVAEGASTDSKNNEQQKAIDVIPDIDEFITQLSNIVFHVKQQSLAELDQNQLGQLIDSKNIQTLISTNAPLHAPIDKHKNTLLHLAVQKKSVDTCFNLMKAGINIMVKNSAEQTAFEIPKDKAFISAIITKLADEKSETTHRRYPKDYENNSITIPTTFKDNKLPSGCHTCFENAVKENLHQSDYLLISPPLHTKPDAGNFFTHLAPNTYFLSLKDNAQDTKATFTLTRIFHENL